MGMPVIRPSSDGASLLAVCTVFAILAVVATALRLWARHLMRLSLALDDYLALSSMIVILAELPIIYAWVLLGGSGNDITVVLAQSPTAVTYGLKLVFISQFLYGYSASAIKLSLLAFYWRIFPTQFVRRGIYLLAFCCIGWLIAIMIVNILECRPISYFWTQSGNGSCTVNPITYFKYNSLTNTFIDLLTLWLPVREVLRLQMSNAKKLVVIGIFTIGSLVVIASIVRFASLVIVDNENSTNITKQWCLMSGATVVEVYIAIIGSCVVTMGPVYRRLRYGHPQGTSRSRPTGSAAQSRSRGSKVMGKLVGRSRNSFELLDKDVSSQTKIVAGETNPRPPSKGIRVERNIVRTESQHVHEATGTTHDYGWSQV